MSRVLDEWLNNGFISSEERRWLGKACWREGLKFSEVPVLDVPFETAAMRTAKLSDDGSSQSSRSFHLSTDTFLDFVQRIGNIDERVIQAGGFMVIRPSNISAEQCNIQERARMKRSRGDLKREQLLHNCAFLKRNLKTDIHKQTAICRFVPEMASEVKPLKFTYDEEITPSSSPRSSKRGRRSGSGSLSGSASSSSTSSPSANLSAVTAASSTKSRKRKRSAMELSLPISGFNSSNNSSSSSTNTISIDNGYSESSSLAGSLDRTTKLPRVIHTPAARSNVGSRLLETDPSTQATNNSDLGSRVSISESEDISLHTEEDNEGKVEYQRKTTNLKRGCCFALRQEWIYGNSDSSESQRSNTREKRTEPCPNKRTVLQHWPRNQYEAHNPNKEGHKTPYMQASNEELFPIFAASLNRKGYNVNYGIVDDHSVTSDCREWSDICAIEWPKLSKNHSLFSFLSDEEKMLGIQVPYCYLGKNLTWFAMHREDGNFFACNQLLFGDTKVWWCVKPKDYRKVSLFARYLYHNRELDNDGGWCHDSLIGGCANFLQHKTFMFDPYLLLCLGIEVMIIRQRPGDIVITPPSGLHCGFNTGFNLCESVNFLTYSESALKHAFSAMKWHLLSDCHLCLNHAFVDMIRLCLRMLGKCDSRRGTFAYREGATFMMADTEPDWPMPMDLAITAVTNAYNHELHLNEFHTLISNPWDQDVCMLRSIVNEETRRWLLEKSLAVYSRVRNASGFRIGNVFPVKRQFWESSHQRWGDYIMPMVLVRHDDSCFCLDSERFYLYFEFESLLPTLNISNTWRITHSARKSSNDYNRVYRLHSRIRVDVSDFWPGLGVTLDAFVTDGFQWRSLGVSFSHVLEPSHIQDYTKYRKNFRD